MPARLWISAAALVLGVAGCAVKKVPPPPVRTVTVGGLKADYREYGKTDVCAMEAPSLEKELESLRILLAEFLGQTSAGFDGMWAEEHLALLQEGARELPPVLNAAEKATSSLPNCPRLNVPSGPGAGELIRQTRRRLEEAPLLLPYLQAKREVALWTEAQASTQQALKSERCAKKSKGPVMFYAAENERGDQVFHFCDGARVQRRVGGETTLEADKPNKKINVATYEALLAKVPPEEIRRAPKLPSKIAPRASDKDSFDLNSPTEP